MTKISIALLAFIISGCASFGQSPSESDLEGLSRSKQFHPRLAKFVNRNQAEIDEFKKRRGTMKMLNAVFSGGDYLKPQRKLPEVKPDLKKFAEKSTETKFIWLGHSTFLVNIEGKTLLFDPIFSDHASPVGLVGKRFQPPIVGLKDLPKIDFIIISHDHYDHLDMDSIKFFKEKDTHFLAPLGVPSHLKYWGIKDEKISEMDWWDSVKFGPLEFVSTPSQHFSGRTGPNSNKTLWSSWVVRGKKKSIFYSGDGGYDIHFKSIGKKYGPFELAFMENGQYNELWSDVHMLPEQTVQAFKDVKGENLVSVHWGMFDLSIHNWFEPIERVSALMSAEKLSHYTPKLGEVVQMGTKRIFPKWWKENMKRDKEDE